jgi:alpha-tubulin suppressor-like RCC1 family protein
VTAISVGADHCLALDASGWVWAWGLNNNGQLGQSDNLKRLSPVRVGWGATAIAAGLFHSMALVGDSRIWAWGYNGFGQLGMGDYKDRWMPEYIAGTSGTVALATGFDFGIAISPMGAVMTWGNNADGQLGAGDNLSRLTPYTNPGTLAKAVSAGGTHSLYLEASGTLWTTGQNQFGQLCIGTTTNKNSWQFAGGGYIDVAGTVSNSYAITGIGDLYSCGYNTNGQIGDGTTMNRLSPVLVPGMPYCTGVARGFGYHVAALTTPPVMLYALKLVPATLTGGSSAVGTVTLTALAGPGGLKVLLSSSSTAAGVPAAVTVPAGSKTATFPVTTTAVGVVTKPVIKATLVVSKSATLTVNP